MSKLTGDRLNLGSGVRYNFRDERLLNCPILRLLPIRNCMAVGKRAQPGSKPL